MVPARTSIVGAILLALSTFAMAEEKVRIKDVTMVEGTRSNPIYGQGLVIGLNGTGGKSLVTQQAATQMLTKLQARPDVVFKSNNMSLVMVTAEIQPFARRGSRLDITVSALDDATSLQGGTLLLTPLQGADGQVYAVAQGPISVVGFSYSGKAATAQKNHPTVGRVPNGAIVEREALGHYQHNGCVRLLLHEPDFSTAQSVAKAIQEKFPGGTTVLDPGTVQVRIPRSHGDNPVGFVNDISLLKITPDSVARVVINERTGTVVAGEHVKIGLVAIANGSIEVTTTEDQQVSQPAPYSRGKTTVVDRTNLDVVEQNGRVQVLERTTTVADLARALNALGVSPRDLISIFQAIKEAKALHADLVVM